MTKEEFMKYLDDENNIVPIVCYIPNNTCRVVIGVVAMDDDGEMHEASKVMSLPEIVNARIDGEECEGENVKYCLTDKAELQMEYKGVEQFAKDTMEQMRKGRRDD